MPGTPTDVRLGDCLDVMRAMPDDSVHAIVTDPPYGLGFMGKEWDDLPPGVEWAEECLRVLRPGGYLLAFGGTRTFHRLACAVEDAGFEIRDSIAWLYGSGFSKSWNFKTQFQGAWCECANPLPYDHAGNAEMHRVRGGLSATVVTCGARDGADVLPEVQRHESGPGLGDAWAQGSGGLVAGGIGVGSREDEWPAEPGMAGRDVHRTGQGLPDGPLAGASTCPGERVRGGASAGHGADDRAAGAAARGSASRQRGPGRQPSGEPAAVPGSHDALDDGALRDGPVCPSCGGLDPAFKGFGTGIKPSHEPIVVARKPLTGTVAANVQAWGTGALNIDATRVTGEKRAPGFTASEGNARCSGSRAGGPLARLNTDTAAGRWPANVVLDGSQADALDQQSAGTRAAKAAASGSGGRKLGYHGGATTDVDIAGYGDEGGASRFFPTFRYQAKAPTAERPSYVKEGAADHRAGGNFAGGIRVCNVCQNRTKPGNYVGGDDRPWPACGHNDWDWGTPKEQGGKVAHPTVKPLGLMRWLVRLVTPPGGTVLDPFAGSGATVEACLLEGFDCIAIERDPDYLPLIQQRIDRQAATLPLDRPA